MINVKGRLADLGQVETIFLTATGVAYRDAHNECKISYSSRSVLDSRGNRDCVADIDYAPCVS